MTSGARDWRARSCGVLVVAKAPVPGLAKTRIGAVVGAEAAAELAAAALLDTLDAVERWEPACGRLLAMTGSLQAAARRVEISQRLATWTVVEQRGATFADRLVSAHREAALRWGPDLPVVQIGMDTPGITGGDLDAIVGALDGAPPDAPPGAASGAPSGAVDVALGPAFDGGWWGLATARPGYGDQLAGVPMSRSDTAARTVAALQGAGARVRLVHELRDVDDWADAVALSRSAPQSRTAQVVRRLQPKPEADDPIGTATVREHAAVSPRAGC